MKAGAGTAWILAQAACAVSSTAPDVLGDCAPEAARREAIEQLFSSFERSYDAADVAGLADLWFPDGDLHTLSGGVVRGREAVRDFYERLLAGPYRDSRFTLTAERVRFLTCDIAVVDGRWSVRGDALPAGQPTAGLVTQVLVRTRDRWGIVSARPSVPRRGHTKDLGR